MGSVCKGIVISVIWMAFGAGVAMIAIHAKEALGLAIGMGIIALLATLAVTHAK